MAPSTRPTHLARGAVCILAKSFAEEIAERGKVEMTTEVQGTEAGDFPLQKSGISQAQGGATEQRKVYREGNMEKAHCKGAGVGAFLYLNIRGLPT